MQWTLIHRIYVGYAISLVLILAVAGIGILALRNSTNAYQSALQHQREVLTSALRADYEARGAVIHHLQFLAQPSERHVEARDSLLALSYAALESLRDSAETPGLHGIWEQSLRQLARWEEVSDHSIGALRAGLPQEAVTLHNTEAVPARDRHQAIMSRGIRQIAESTDSAVTTAREADTRMAWLLIIVAGVALAATIAETFALSRAVVGPVQKAAIAFAARASEVLEASVYQTWVADRMANAVDESLATVDELFELQTGTGRHASALSEIAGQFDGSRAVADPSGLRLDLEREIERLETLSERRGTELEQIRDLMSEVGRFAQENLEATHSLELIARRLNRQGMSLLSLVPAERAGASSRRPKREDGA